MRRPSSGLAGDPGFRALWIGRTASYAGDALTLVALPFAVFESGGSLVDVGFVLAASRIARIAFVLVGGVVADRLPRRLVLIGSDTLQLVAQACTAAVLLLGVANVGTLIALRVVYAIGMAVFLPAVNGLIPQLVPTEKLQKANAALSLSRDVSSVVGPLIAGALAATIGSGWVFAIDALTFLVSVATLAVLRVPPAPARVRQSILADLREGWAEFTRRRWFWSSVIVVAVWQFAITAFFVLGPAVAEESLGGPAAWGVVTAAMAAGGVLGGLLLFRLPLRRPLLVASLVLGLSAAQMVALAGPAPLAVVALSVAVASVGVVIAGGAFDTTMQALVPEHVISRLTSYDVFLSMIMSPVGFLLAGPAAEAFGTRATLIGSAVLLLLPGLLLLLDPQIRGVRKLPDGTILEAGTASTLPRQPGVRVAGEAPLAKESER